MKKVLAVLFSFCLSFEHTTFALHNSDKMLGWSAGWSWGRGENEDAGLADEALVEMLYTTSLGTMKPDHPTLEQRLQYRRAYEVTEEPESDWSDDNSSFEGKFNKPSLDHPFEYSSYSYPDNAISQDTSHKPTSSSSSMFMSSGDGESLYASYAHKIIHS